MNNPWPICDRPKIEVPKLTLAQALLDWDNSKKFLEQAKEAELRARKIAFFMGFGEDAKEGTNTEELANGYKLKGVRKFNYKLVAPEGFESKVGAVDNCIAAFRKISNEGAFIADRIFKWDVDLSVTEYRKLVEESATSATATSLLNELNKVLEITEATPTLTIVEPKSKK
jgi:hypothetical protein